MATGQVHPYIWNGTSWALASAPPPADGDPHLLSCASPTFCMGITPQNTATIWNGSSWSPPVKYDKDFNAIPTSLSCPSTSFCVVVDSADGTAFTYNGSTWSAATVIDPAAAAATAAVNNGSSNDLLGMSVSCPSAQFCAAADTFGNAMTFNGSTWSQPVAILPKNANALRPPLACPAATYCVLSSRAGYKVWDGSAWSALKSIAPAGFPAGFDGFNLVSCASASFCYVIAAGSLLGILSGTTFTQSPVGERGPRQTEALSCPTKDFCMATGPYGYADTWHSS